MMGRYQELEALRLNDREQRELTMVEVLRDLVRRIESGELAVLNFILSEQSGFDGLSQDGRILKFRGGSAPSVKIEIEVAARKVRDVTMPTIEDMGLGDRPETKPVLMGARDLILDD